MVDARYYEASGTSVCMMVIGNILTIEFGRTGNACYFYRAPVVPLRTIQLPRRASADTFKLRAWRVRSGQSELEFGQTMLH
ncbi:unnamed protein product, partial [Laminaria digitata]